MSRYSSNDEYCYPESDVLKNKHGIIDQVGLDKLESEYVSLRLVELAEKPLTLPFTVETVKYIHKILFGDIYQWAGEFRRIDISKGNSRFANINFIESYLTNVLIDLANDGFLENSNKKDFAEKAAYYMGEINAIHPFREGNGRTQREFINQLAYNAQYYISWSDISSEDILEATIKSFNGDIADLERLIFDNLFELDYS